ncbi:3-oxoacyl-ACP reductase [Solibacillus sp. MA9]|uniref:3-oxoacyl-ACP reductase n=1 Tax=Solibacillus palustris TaxID=2908203 RepID=A0ABS9UHM5_9BACL|nr:3-oxoacyl-ACP reductase [Solibacillus sp. MA9]MCH7323655.1 3-oxoacyl-ACP reductase [Solibacillus sp. MA9]
MAKFKGKGVVVAGLLAGAASFLSKKENRDKAMDFLNDARDRATKAVNEQKQNFQGTKQYATEEEHIPVGDVAGDVAEGAASKKTLTIDENEFISEGGAQRMIDQYNEQQHQQ